MTYTPLNKRIKSQRTGKNTVAFVGYAETTRGLTPWEDPDTEIWGLNEAGIQPWMKRFDRWFQIHPEGIFSRPNNPSDPEHLKWLEQLKGKPIYMQNHYDNIPESIQYPIDEVTNLYGNYQTSTLAYMLCLALLEEFERIEIYGFEMGTRTEYHYQRANGEYLIGLARGLGCEVYLPPSCGLCKGKRYGYEGMKTAFRQRIETRFTLMEEEVNNKRDEAHKALGVVEGLEKAIQSDPGNQILVKLLEAQRLIAQSTLAKSNYVVGCRAELKKTIDSYDDFLEVTGVSKNDRTEHGKASNG